jgi:hypothetical protein
MPWNWPRYISAMLRLRASIDRRRPRLRRGDTTRVSRPKYQGYDAACVHRDEARRWASGTVDCRRERWGVLHSVLLLVDTIHFYPNKRSVVYSISCGWNNSSVLTTRCNLQFRYVERTKEWMDDEGVGTGGFVGGRLLRRLTTTVHVDTNDCLVSWNIDMPSVCCR